MVDDIEAAIGGRDADTVFFAFERYKGFESALGGRRVTAVEARGKAVLVFFAARGDDARGRGDETGRREGGPAEEEEARCGCGSREPDGENRRAQHRGGDAALADTNQFFCN